MIKIKPYNEIFYYIDSDYETLNKLTFYFKVRSPSFFFDPRYKNGIWDGFIQLFKQDNLLYRGLLNDLNKFCINNNIELINEDSFNSIDVDDESLNSFINELDLSTLNRQTNIRSRISFRDYQLESLKLCIKNQKQLIESPTSSGKSLVIYTLIRYLQPILNDKKILLIVPAINLVNQMYSDFEDYSFFNSWKTEENCCKIYSGKDKSLIETSNTLISTWQSLKDLPKEFFYQFKVVICDEVQGAKAKELNKILTYCINSKYRFGFTGTVPKELLFKKQILGIFINHNVVTTYEELKQNDYITGIDIKCIQLNYDISQEKNVKRKYQDELSYIQGSNRRQELLVKLGTVKNNSLFLFTKVAKHSKYIFDKMKKDERLKDKEIYLIDSSTKIKDRDEIKAKLEKQDNIIILSTYKLLSTGWSVNNLHNIIFADPLKSDVTIPQSIGRGLRTCNDKDHFNLFDVVDKFNYTNTVFKHYKERKKMYDKFNFKNSLTVLTESLV